MYKKSEKLKLIRGFLEDANCLTVSISKAGIKSPYTVSLWRKRPMVDRYIKHCMNRSDTRRVDAVVDALFKQAISGNIAACAFFLKNKAGWKDSVEHSGEIKTGETKIILITPSERKQVAEASRIEV